MLATLQGAFRNKFPILLKFPQQKINYGFTSLNASLKLASTVSRGVKVKWL